MILRSALCLILLAVLTGCAKQRAGGDYGSTHTHRFQQPPGPAARCFARNAEAHSSALMSQVTATREGGAQVIVQVRNGVTYASADFRRAGSASIAAITLMARASGGQNDLLHALVEGC